MKQINLTPYILPTTDASNLYIDTINNILKFGAKIKAEKTDHESNHHLYLCSTEGIKEGEWMIDGSGRPRTAQRDLLVEEVENSFCRKVVLTTDPALIAEGVEKIYGRTIAQVNSKRDEAYFLSEFCKRWNDKGDAKSEGYSLDELAEELHQWSDPHIEGDITRSDCKLLIEWFKIKLEGQSLTKPTPSSLSISYNTETRSLTIK